MDINSMPALGEILNIQLSSSETGVAVVYCRQIQDSKKEVIVKQRRFEPL